jgi:hypothetical protein
MDSLEWVNLPTQQNEDTPDSGFSQGERDLINATGISTKAQGFSGS